MLTFAFTCLRSLEGALSLTMIVCVRFNSTSSSYPVWSSGFFLGFICSTWHTSLTNYKFWNISYFLLAWVESVARLVIGMDIYFPLIVNLGCGRRTLKDSLGLFLGLIQSRVRLNPHFQRRKSRYRLPMTHAAGYLIIPFLSSFSCHCYPFSPFSFSYSQSFASTSSKSTFSTTIVNINNHDNLYEAKSWG